MRLPRENQPDVGIVVRGMPVVDVESIGVKVAEVDDVTVGIERYLSIFVYSHWEFSFSVTLSDLFAIFPVFYLTAALISSGHLL